jgi:hypothetical protein
LDRTFAIGFLVRPIGAWISGIYADRRGRCSALLVSVSMMCFGALMITTTPTCRTIEIAAPIVLTTARDLQGLSIGGKGGSASESFSRRAGTRQNFSAIREAFRYTKACPMVHLLPVVRDVAGANVVLRLDRTRTSDREQPFRPAQHQWLFVRVQLTTVFPKLRAHDQPFRRLIALLDVAASRWHGVK